MWGVPPAVANRNVATAKIYALRLGALGIAAILLYIIHTAMWALPWYLAPLVALVAALAWAHKFERHAR